MDTQALIEPFLKQFKQKIDAVIVDGERADVKQPASTFVKHADRAVSVKLVRPGDISHALQLAHALQTSAGDILPDALQSPAVPGLPISSSSAVPPGMPPAYTAVAQQPSEEGELEAAIAA